MRQLGGVGVRAVTAIREERAKAELSQLGFITGVSTEQSSPVDLTENHKTKPTGEIFLC